MLAAALQNAVVVFENAKTEKKVNPSISAKALGQ